MTNGDTAAALGWTTFPSSQPRNMGYDDINYSLDRAADQANRLTKVEAAVLQPLFSVRKSGSTLTINNNTWTQVTAPYWGSPDINTGFGGWSGGVLTVSKAGVYRVAGGVQYMDTTPEVEMQVVKNTTSPNSGNTIIKAGMGGRGAAKSGLVRLVAGDALTMLIYASNTTGAKSTVENNPYDLTLDLEWLRA